MSHFSKNLIPHQRIFGFKKIDMDTKSGIIPTLGYKDPKKAIQWLCDAFGFEKHEVYESEDGKVIHAELTYKGNMIMLGSSDRDSQFLKLIKHPSEIDGFVTQSPYIIIDDDEIEAHYENVRRHGAKTALELTAQDYGGKDYTCHDPEGHVWSFGSYDPWE